MAKMNNIIKEHIGVHQLSIALLSTCQLIPDIRYNDKTPAFDGHVEIYNENSIKKTDLIGIVDVQVKSTEQKKLAEKFSVSKTDLESFLKRDGVLFFVILFDEGKEPSFYYRDLHVFSILNFLKNIGKRKTVSIDLYQFPQKSNEIVDTFLHFHHQQGMNKGSDKRNEIEKRLAGNFTREDREFKLHYAFSKNSTYQDQINFMLSHKTLLFESTNDSPFEIPVDEFQPQMVSESIPQPIIIDGTEFYDSYEKINKRDGWEVIIGNCLHIYSGKKEVLLTTEDIPLLSERAKAMKFIASLYKGKDFFVGHKKINYPIIHDDYSDAIRSTEKTCAVMSLVQDFLHRIGVTDDFDFSQSSDYEWDLLSTIADSYINGTPITIRDLKPNDVFVMYINTGNLSLLLYFYSDSELNYYCKNFFDDGELITYVIEEKTQKKFIMSKFLKLEVEDFLKASNINFMQIERSLFQYELTPVNSGMITQFILKMIAAYDLSDSLRVDILESAQRISKRLIQEKGGQSCEVEKINLYQIIARQRELTPSEIEELYKLKYQFSDKSGQICINILLKNFEEAQRIFNTLDEEEKRNFRGFPICKLWGKDYDVREIASSLRISKDQM